MSRSSGDGLRVVRPGPTFRGKQGHLYSPAISAEAVGSKALHMQLLRIPPGEVGRAHKHEGHETAIYILSGEAGTWYGDDLAFHQTARAGDFVYIAAGVPHRPYNMRDDAEVIAVIARTDPNEQESVVLLPALDRSRTVAEPAGAA
ncbi:hypothetical protein OPKNFCMD_6462 [Methylobacterium crusticola]|uniref:Cupin type-2 domain-containing protein n=1 Tax=Methylobacterium crusticola TaxID=1697972 RepID=A0ABQ4R7I8_9HYPH|nr:cupin domain-containing protein [Methylobacterium crusticola]GJD53685.1 hypothetical protein OPKNFCMD_6462 [Methylobacterium crusticola]